MRQIGGVGKELFGQEARQRLSATGADPITARHVAVRRHELLGHFGDEGEACEVERDRAAGGAVGVDQNDTGAEARGRRMTDGSELDTACVVGSPGPGQVGGRGPEPGGAAECHEGHNGRQLLKNVRRFVIIERKVLSKCKEIGFDEIADRLGKCLRAGNPVIESEDETIGSSLFQDWHVTSQGPCPGVPGISLHAGSLLPRGCANVTNYCVSCRKAASGAKTHALAHDHPFDDRSPPLSSRPSLKCTSRCVGQAVACRDEGLPEMCPWISPPKDRPGSR